MFRQFFSTAYIVVVDSDYGVEIGVYSVKGKNIVKKYNRIYEQASSAKRFLEQIISAHYFCYVAQLFKSIGQGVLPSKDKRELVKYGIEPTNIGLISMGSFYIYTSKSEIESSHECCGDILSSDLLYSPFSVLHVLQSKESDKACNLHLLKYKNLVAIMIYKGATAKFGNYFELKVTNVEGEENKVDQGSLQELEYDNTEDFEELNFDDFDDLDSSNTTGLLELDQELSGEASLVNFDTEMAIFNYLKVAIKEFYENNIYENDFIDNIYIYEHEDSSSAFLTMIKTEFYLNPKVRKIDIFYEIFALACRDLGANIDL